jgi:hypothetical protein
VGTPDPGHPMSWLGEAATGKCKGKCGSFDSWAARSAAHFAQDDSRYLMLGMAELGGGLHANVASSEGRGFR